MGKKKFHPGKSRPINGSQFMLAKNKDRISDVTLLATAYINSPTFRTNGNVEINQKFNNETSDELLKEKSSLVKGISTKESDLKGNKRSILAREGSNPKRTRTDYVSTSEKTNSEHVCDKSRLINTSQNFIHSMKKKKFSSQESSECHLTRNAVNDFEDKKLKRDDSKKVHSTKNDVNMECNNLLFQPDSNQKCFLNSMKNPSFNVKTKSIAIKNSQLLPEDTAFGTVSKGKFKCTNVQREASSKMNKKCQKKNLPSGEWIVQTIKKGNLTSTKAEKTRDCNSESKLVETVQTIKKGNLTSTKPEKTRHCNSESKLVETVKTIKKGNLTSTKLEKTRDCNSESKLVEMRKKGYTLPENLTRRYVAGRPNVLISKGFINSQIGTSLKNSENLNVTECNRNYNVPNTLCEGNVSSTMSSAENLREKTIQNNPVATYKIFDISATEVILVLPPLCSVFFKGALRARVLIGKVKVLGYEMCHDKSEEYTIYSPYGDSLLGLEACTENLSHLSEENFINILEGALNKIDMNNNFRKEILQKIPAYSSVILVKYACGLLLSFLKKNLPISHFPMPTSRSRPGEDASGPLQVMFLDQSLHNNKLYTQPPYWDSLVEHILLNEPEKTRIMVCGGKCVGKSTFLRFLTNKMLPKYNEVLFIDFDPGQCEFTPPACVSAVVVRNPLLGPNFTHLTEPERMVYIGEVDMTRCAVHYLNSAKHVFDWCCSQMHLMKMPWVINTMGFVRGLGVQLMMSLLKIVNPSDLVQIESSLTNRNYPFVLKKESVQNFDISLFKVPIAEEKALNYTLHVILSAAETSYDITPWGIKSYIARNTSILAYFSQVVTPPKFSLLGVVPRVLCFEGLKLCVSHENLKFTDFLSVFNANLVGLCNAGNVHSVKSSNPHFLEIIEMPPICHYFGLGIVRGIDVEKKSIYIISTLSSETFKQVNCLVLGSVCLPDSVYVFQDEAKGSIPYVIENSLLPLDRGVRKSKSVKKVRKRFIQ